MDKSIELTLAQAEAIRQHPEAMLDLVDPTTQEQYVLVPRSVLELLQEEAEDARQILGWERRAEQGSDWALQNDV